MKEATIVFPHQLFETNPCVDRGHKVYLLEENLFFRQVKFHKQKMILHMASMQYYRDYLVNQGHDVAYVKCTDDRSDVRILVRDLASSGIEKIHYTEVVDDWLEKRIKHEAERANIEVKRYITPMFVNDSGELSDFFADRNRIFQTDFYIEQRKKRRILIDKDGKPAGGKWSYDAENRNRYPNKKSPPDLGFPKENSYISSARARTETLFGENPGNSRGSIVYPVTHQDAKCWLDRFLEERFHEFGLYEDAIVYREYALHHSVLTPMLNTGLLTPREVIDRALDYADTHTVPVNSLEGFIRQILGWREFMRAVYCLKGAEERTKNFWGFNRKIPETFWTGTTGIFPVDHVIGKVLETGYAHHIERLMVLGNFMLLCEFDPDEVYHWFMEMFIDAYDWVMVPNVYGMSQFADGGIMSTKPYISGSNYLLKMSDFPKGDWQDTWDALFWRFMHVHRDFFSKNPRMNMLLSTFDRMKSERQQLLLSRAEYFLGDLDQ